jgi:hypothetical protein
MERPFELLTIVAVVAVVAVALLGRHPGSLRRQAVVGVAIGVTSAIAVMTQQVDLIPDALELPIAALSAGSILALLAMLGLRRARRPRRPRRDGHAPG